MVIVEDVPKAGLGENVALVLAGSPEALRLTPPANPPERPIVTAKFDVDGSLAVIEVGLAATEKSPVAAVSVILMVCEVPSSFCLTVMKPVRVPRSGLADAVKLTVNWNVLPPPPPAGLTLIKEELLTDQWQLMPEPMLVPPVLMV